MTLAVIFFSFALIIESAMLFAPARKPGYRLVWASIGIGLLLALTIYMILIRFNVWALLFGVISAYRAVGMLRIVKGRMHLVYLKHACRRTSAWLLASHLIVTAGWILWDITHPSAQVSWGVLLGLQLIAASVLAWSVWRHVFKSSGLNTDVAHYSDNQLPSLSIAVAARNEADDLIACIDSLLALDYPKLEILVLDDCSQTRRTTEIIRSYAHRGVRFIPGKEPAENWLAKNHAYESLAAAANGQWILFAGVNTRFAPDSARKLMGYTLSRHNSMLSVMPRNRTNHQGIPLIEPMRYGWELALPRHLFGRPPVLSSCWLINRSALKQLGGFKAVSRMIVPETYFARALREASQYNFLISGDKLGVSSHKSVSQQRATATRVSYPALHRRPEMTALTSVAVVAVGLMPLGIAAGSLLVSQQYIVVTAVAVSTCVILYTAYAGVLRLIYGRVSPLHVLAYPAAIAAYVGLINYSMYKYEFSTVIWKDRNICIPVMHVIPHLPKID